MCVSVFGVFVCVRGVCMCVSVYRGCVRGVCVCVCASVGVRSACLRECRCEGGVCVCECVGVRGVGVKGVFVCVRECVYEMCFCM